MEAYNAVLLVVSLLALLAAIVGALEENEPLIRLGQGMGMAALLLILAISICS